MKHLRLLPLLGVMLGCGGGPRTSPAPAPAPVLAQGDTADASAPRPAVRDTISPVQTAAASAAAADSVRPADPDSAADAAILEQLATAHPEPQDSGNEDGAADAVPGGANGAATPEVTYDIDVSTYGSHARVQYYLDFFQGPARDRFAIWLQRMPRFEPMIRAKLRENGVPEDMVYLALIESGFSSSAVSRARATGMWQFMKGTGKLYGLRIDSWVDERRDPVRATDAAARHLADLRDRFGSMYLAAAAYNAGAGKVGRGLRRIGDDDEEEDNPDAAFFRLYDTRFLRRETKDYVPKLIAAALIAKQPEKYGFEKTVGVEPMSYDSIVVSDATGLDVLARLADTTVAAMRELNPQFVRLVTPPRQSAIVRLPAGSADLVTSRYAALAARDRVSFVDHTVSRGQTVASIARLYHVSTRQISDANPGVRLTRMRAGTHLMIPTSFVPTVVEPATPAVTRNARVAAGGSTTIRYRVRSGESLTSIAGKYDTSVERLRSLNAIGRREVLRAGQIIRVPAPTAPSPERSTAPAAAEAGKAHVVRRGETLSGIASRYGVSLSALRDANGLTASSVLKSGDHLKIPQ
jgi:membrane-bound lytic murein transglycosylase D